MSALRLWLNSAALARRHPLVRSGGMVALAALALALAIGLSYWWPAQRDHAQAGAEVDGQRKALMLAMQAKEIAQAHANAAKQIEALERKLNATNVQASLVEQLARLAGKHRVRIVSEVFEQGREQKGDIPLHLELTVQGSYVGLRAFLVGLQALPTWTFVQEGAISADKDGGLLKARLRLVTYRRVAGEQVRGA